MWQREVEESFPLFPPPNTGARDNEILSEMNGHASGLQGSQQAVRSRFKTGPLRMQKCRLDRVRSYRRPLCPPGRGIKADRPRTKASTSDSRRQDDGI